MVRLRFGQPGPVRNAVSLYFWASVAAFLLVLSIFKQELMPAKFFYDALTIDSMIGSVPFFVPGASYASTAYFYSLLGVDVTTQWFIVVSSFLVVMTMAACLNRLGRSTIDLADAVIVVFLSFLAITYVPFLSKEFIAFLPTIAFFLALRFGVRSAIASWFVLVVLYGLVFRTYWVLFAIQFLLLYFIFSKTRSIKVLLIATLASLFCITMILSYGLGIDVDSLRNDVNERRLDQGVEDAKTMIQPWLGQGSPVNTYFNLVITLVTLIIPVPLALMFTIYHGFVFIMLSWIARVVGKRAKSYTATRSAGRDVLYEFSLVAVVAFVSIQCIFEPDYGSYLRHLSPFYPFIIISAFRAVQRGVGNPSAPSNERHVQSLGAN